MSRFAFSPVHVIAYNCFFDHDGFALFLRLKICASGPRGYSLIACSRVSKSLISHDARRETDVLPF